MNQNFHSLTICCSTDSEIAQEPKLIIQEALDLLRDFPEEYHDIVKRTLPDTPSLTPLRGQCPWAVLFGTLSKGTVTIAGDAMHGMTPYIGQGGSSTVEEWRMQLFLSDA